MLIILLKVIELKWGYVGGVAEYCTHIEWILHPYHLGLDFIVALFVVFGVGFGEGGFGEFEGG